MKYGTQELHLRKSYIEKTLSEKLKGKLILEIPQRYFIAGSRQLNCPLLGMDVAIS